MRCLLGDPLIPGPCVIFAGSGSGEISIGTLSGVSRDPSDEERCVVGRSGDRRSDAADGTVFVGDRLFVARRRGSRATSMLWVAEMWDLWENWEDIGSSGGSTGEDSSSLTKRVGDLSLGLILSRRSWIACCSAADRPPMCGLGSCVRGERLSGDCSTFWDGLSNMDVSGLGN